MPPLPRIAFFHGGGSNSVISEVQCSQLSSILNKNFEFSFFNAPFTRSAGPGVLPAFADVEYQPYRTWFTTNPSGEELSDGSGFESVGSAGEDGVERVWELLRREEAEGLEKGKGKFVGVMGFSQGTRVVGGLLLDMQRRKEAGLWMAGKEAELKFGVLCMGGGAPMVGAISRGLLLRPSISFLDL
jgi:hypothetical protein